MTLIPACRTGNYCTYYGSIVQISDIANQGCYDIHWLFCCADCPSWSNFCGATHVCIVLTLTLWAHLGIIRSSRHVSSLFAMTLWYNLQPWRGQDGGQILSEAQRLRLRYPVPRPQPVCRRGIPGQSSKQCCESRSGRIRIHPGLFVLDSDPGKIIEKNK